MGAYPLKGSITVVSLFLKMFGFRWLHFKKMNVTTPLQHLKNIGLNSDVLMSIL